MRRHALIGRGFLSVGFAGAERIYLSSFTHMGLAFGADATSKDVWEDLKACGLQPSVGVVPVE